MTKHASFSSVAPGRRTCPHDEPYQWTFLRNVPLRRDGKLPKLGPFGWKPPPCCKKKRRKVTKRHTQLEKLAIAVATEYWKLPVRSWMQFSVPSLRKLGKLVKDKKLVKNLVIGKPLV